jgi:hypothetical protein
LPIYIDSALKKVDSVFLKDSLAKNVALTDSLRKDSLNKVAIANKHHAIPTDTSTYTAIMVHKFLPWKKPPTFMVIKEWESPTKDGLFYLVLGLVLVFAIFKVVFKKYLFSIFGLFFQTSFRQKQTREQLFQNNFASMLLNLFFVISGACFIALLAQYKGHWQISLWWLLLYAAILLLSVYTVKYLFLVFSGWVFNAQEAAGNYIFLVFLANKIAGVVLIPFVIILAFSPSIIAQPAITVSLIIIGILLIYRYIVSLGTIRNTLKVNALHFFLYLCAVEVLPLMVVFKLLFNFAGKNF